MLNKRGLIISKKSEAEKYLKEVSYYRLSAYCLPFEVERHKFKSNVRFEDIIDLYKFDRKLRQLIDDALERIEIFIRSIITDHIAHAHGTFSHEKKDIFYIKFKHYDWIDKIHKEAKRSKETFIEHYKNNYTGFPKLPIWMASEICLLVLCLSFIMVY